MRGLLDPDQRAEAWRMIEAIAAVEKKPVMAESDRQALRRLWRDKEVKTVADFEVVKMIHGRIRKG